MEHTFLKFTLSSELGIFRDFTEDGYGYQSKQIPDPIQFKGMIGAILGLDGNEREINKRIYNPKRAYELPSYLTNLKNLEYSIVTKDIFKRQKYGFLNTMGTLKTRTKTEVLSTNSVQFDYNVLHKPEYIVFIKKNSIPNELYEKLHYMLKNDISHYHSYLGIKDFNTEFSNVEEIVMLEQKTTEPIRLHNWFLNKDIKKIKEESCDWDWSEPISLVQNSCYTELDKDFIRFNRELFIRTNALVSPITSYYSNKDFNITLFKNN